jgi:membrane-associated phospholipid phosphatase
VAWWTWVGKGDAAIMGQGSTSINTRWYLELNHLARDSAWAHGIMKVYANLLGVGLLAVVLLAAWWWARKAADPARTVAGVLWAAGGTVVAWVVAHYGLKPLVGERRPYLVLPHVEVLLHRTTGFSFPSGHATVAGGVAVGLLLARRPLASAWAIVLGLLLGFGRVYTGMHYPFDVVAGFVVGGVVVAALWVPAVAILTGIDRLLLRTPLAPLVSAHLRRPGLADPSPSGGDDRVTATHAAPAAGGTWIPGEPWATGEPTAVQPTNGGLSSLPAPPPPAPSSSLPAPPPPAPSSSPPPPPASPVT